VAYDQELAWRLRELLADTPGVSEKRMFGGLAFLVGGHMTVSASGQGGLLARVGEEGEDDALAQPHARQMVMRGRPMPGWIRVDSTGLSSDAELTAWVRRAVAFTSALPAKS
jgi:TfoX/Sxy family transcriptional regulator of competence genes